jgi:hypothetical protein
VEREEEMGQWVEEDVQVMSSSMTLNATDWRCVEQGVVREQTWVDSTSVLVKGQGVESSLERLEQKVKEEKLVEAVQQRWPIHSECKEEEADQWKEEHAPPHPSSTSDLAAVTSIDDEMKPQLAGVVWGGRRGRGPS